MKNCVDTFPEVPRIGDGRRNERRVIGPFNFYDCSMIQIGSRAKVSKIFRRVRGRPDTFKMTLRKFEFFRRGENQGFGDFVRKILDFRGACLSRS